MEGLGEGVRGGSRVGRAARGVGRLSRVGARWGDPACSARGSEHPGLKAAAAAD